MWVSAFDFKCFPEELLAVSVSFLALPQNMRAGKPYKPLFLKVGCLS